VRTVTTEQRDVSTELATSSKTRQLVRDAVFVDDDNVTGVEDGSAEFPFNTMQEGVDESAVGVYDTVYVFAGDYRENVVIGNGLDLLGQGEPLGTDYGYGGDLYPVLDGGAGGPAAISVNTVGTVSIRGFEITNDDQRCARRAARIAVQPRLGRAARAGQPGGHVSE